MNAGDQIPSNLIYLITRHRSIRPGGDVVENDNGSEDHAFTVAIYCELRQRYGIKNIRIKKKSNI